MICLLVWLLLNTQRVCGHLHADVHKAAHEGVDWLILATIALSDHDLQCKQFLGKKSTRSSHNTLTVSYPASILLFCVRLQGCAGEKELAWKIYLCHGLKVLSLKQREAKLGATFCLGFMEERRVATVACASDESLGGASRTTPAHLPTISVTSCQRRWTDLDELRCLTARKASLYAQSIMAAS